MLTEGQARTGARAQAPERLHMDQELVAYDSGRKFGQRIDVLWPLVLDGHSAHVYCGAISGSRWWGEFRWCHENRL